MVNLYCVLLILLVMGMYSACSPLDDINTARNLGDAEIRQLQEDHTLILKKIEVADQQDSDMREFIVPITRHANIFAADTTIGRLYNRYTDRLDTRRFRNCVYPFSDALVGRGEEEQLLLTEQFAGELQEIIAVVRGLTTPPHFYRIGEARIDRTGNRALFPLLLTSTRNSTIAQLICGRNGASWEVIGFGINTRELITEANEPPQYFNPQKVSNAWHVR